MKRGIVLMLSLFLLSPTIQAQTTSVACDTAHQTVAFVNGIFNDDDMSGASGSELALMMYEQGSNADVKYYWNPGGHGGNLMDAAQTLANKLIQENTLFDHYPVISLYNTIMHALMGDSSLTIQLTPEQQKALLEASRNSPYLTQNRLTSSGNPVEDSVPGSTQRIYNLTLQDLSRGDRLVLVTHSQGNFYGKAVYAMMQNDHPDLISGLGVVGVAAVTNSLPGNTYVTYERDLVVQLVQSFDPFTLPFNVRESVLTEARLFIADFTGHNFAKTYANPVASMRNRIGSDVASTMTRLQAGNDNNGPITATLTWDVPGDVDLHTYEPDTSHVFYADKAGNAGTLDRDDRVTTGPEHYHTSCQNIVLGTYQFGVNYYRGNGPRTAHLTIDAVGNATRIADLTLPTALGDGGDDTPVILFDVTLANDNGRVKATVARH